MNDDQRSAVNAAINSLQSALALDEVTTIPAPSVVAAPPAPPAPPIILADAPPPQDLNPDTVSAPVETPAYQDNVADPSAFTYDPIPMPEG